MEKYFCIGIFILFLCSCSNPAAPEIIKSEKHTISTNDYILSNPGHFVATIDCSLITDAILQSGSVSVNYQPYNQTWYIPFQWAFTQNNHFYSWNYYYELGKVYLLFQTTNPNEKFPPDGYFLITVISRG